MIWVLQGRMTRSGTLFSPYTGTPYKPNIECEPLRCDAFDFGPLLANAVAQEQSHAEDHEPADDLEPADDGDIDEEYPPFEPPEAIDDVYSPPPSPPPHDPPQDLDDAPERAPPPPERAPPPSAKRARTAFDGDIDEEHPLFDPLDAIDDIYPPPPLAPPHDPLQDLDDVPERAPPPPPKRAHTAFDDMCAGKKPLKMSRSHTTLDATRLPATHGGYAARVESADETWGSKKRRSLPELLGLGFQLVRWNGYDSRPIVDVFGRIIAVLVGQPRSASWDADVASAYQHISAEGAAAAFPHDLRKHRRGGFVAQNVGIYYGQGAKFPTRLRTGMYEPMLDRLLGNPAVARMATFASAAFAWWAPRLHQYYREHANKLHDHYPHLRRNFLRSVFSCAAFNFGPSIWTFRHRDILNAPFGWCAVQSGGEFDATQGGHLVLWDLKLVIEFPAGALMLLPSATIAHSNIPVAPGQTRISFMQYTAGGLMRFVDNGFRTDAEVEAEDPEEFARLAALKDTRWEMGLKLLSTVDDILESLPDAE
ncbi:hypothetical protein B0H17DRAFT_1332964 [Mycena rosella]|uniref:Uncharacterized protein n=1 Tax=Mycena rosella TaxID=1033263 RepID=A0AAD7GFS2_MYCRO|nr:hypothetical protein B0H17DRAFT_1332964 [Mycena rosella]